MGVVRRKQREVVLPRHLDDHFVDCDLFGKLVGHDFQKETLRPENIAVHLGAFQRPFFVPFKQKTGNLARQTGRRADQPLAVLGQQLVIDARLVVKTSRIGDRYKFDQVVIAFIVLGKQQKVVVFFFFIVDAIGADIHFTADDRLDARAFALLIKFDGSIHHAMIGHGHRRHAPFGAALGQVGAAYGAIEKAIFGMYVQMNEILLCGHKNLLSCHTNKFKRPALCISGIILVGGVVSTFVGAAIQQIPFHEGSPQIICERAVF